MRNAGYRLVAAADVVFSALPGRSFTRLRRLSKPALMPTLAAAVLLDQRSASGQRSATLVGIGLSGVGDVALLGSRDPAFIAGLGSFLGAHLAYAIGFAGTAGWPVSGERRCAGFLRSWSPGWARRPCSHGPAPCVCR